MQSPTDHRLLIRDENASSFKRLSILLRPYAWQMTGVLVMLFALTAANMSMPVFIGVLFNDVFPKPYNWRLLWMILGAIILVYVARNTLFFASKFTTVSIGEHVCFNLRKSLFERLQQMNLQFYRQNPPGKVSSRVMNDSFVIQTFIQDDLPKLLQALFLFLGLVATIYALNWQLALASTIILPLHLFASYHFKRPIKQASRTAQEQLDIVQGNLIEKFLGAEVVKSFTGEQRESEAFVEAIDLSRRSQMRSKTYHVVQKVVADLLIGVGTIALLGFAAHQVMRPDGMKPGTFLAFFGFVMMLYPTVLVLINGFAKLAKSAASIDRVCEMLSHNQVEVVAKKPVTRPIRGHIEFKSISYRYEDGPPVLKNVNLEIISGQIYAVFGPSGAGKSTMLNLIPRFLDADKGQVLIDSVDVKEYDLHHLRRSIGIAFQECFMFNSSIFENLRFAQPEATMNQIVEVGKRTGAHDFIEKLPNGYATRLGEDGITLSRGEMQRIALTRAILKRPRILIMDEATASIDAASEAKIVPAVLDFMRGKTTIMITHNIDLLMHADVVVQVVDGHILFQGPPESLPADLMQNTFGSTSGSNVNVDDMQSSGIWRSLQSVFVAAVIGLGAVLGTAAKAVADDSGNDETNEAAAAEVVAEDSGNDETNEAAAAEVMADTKLEDANENESLAFVAKGTFVPLTGLNTLEVDELLTITITRMQAEYGYQRASNELAGNLPEVPQGLQRLTTLARNDENGLHLVQIGYKRFRSQPPYIWLLGATFGESGAGENADLGNIRKSIEDAQKELTTQHENIKPVDLACRRITLSYTDPKRCIEMLKNFGFTIAPGNAPIDPTKLPVIIPVKPTEHHSLIQYKRNAIPNNFKPTEADPITEIAVFYHPTRPEQFSVVLDKVQNIIDIPARQILIEAMVLEISESGLKRLGVEWDLNSSHANLTSFTIGRFPAAATTDEDLIADIKAANIFGEFNVQIQALIRDGSAEVLSRPNILTLDNRMAGFTVQDEIPVVESVTTRNDTVIAKFADPIIAGITLYVRPRASADGEEVSLQIVADISSKVPNEDVIVYNNAALPQEIARSPTIASRTVKTYARIKNNTPLIIGGLIAKDEIDVKNKVPFLGDIPILGDALFTKTRSENLRREVIIVITPKILPEDHGIASTMPKDKDAFDTFGHSLFRDAYRIRAEDVFDLDFMLRNRQLNEYKRLANLAVRKNFELAGRYPFNRFIGKRFPGERILVYRQVYEVIKRLALSESIDEENLIFFAPSDDSVAGFDVSFLWRYIVERAGVNPNKATPENVFKALDGKALALTYTIQVDADVDDILDQPVATLRWYKCPDRETWDKLLWQLNQPDEMERPRHTILINSMKDITRIKRAFLVYRIVQLNANHHELTLTNFSLGRHLLMPLIKPDKIHLIGAQTAMYFFYTEQYYQALEKELKRDLKELSATLQLPDISRYLDEPPPQPDSVVP